MAEPGQKFQHVERELVGEPLAIGERVIRPVARLRGWVGADGGPHGGWGGGWLRDDDGLPRADFRRRDGGTRQQGRDDASGREARRGYDRAGSLMLPHTPCGVLSSPERTTAWSWLRVGH